MQLKCENFWNTYHKANLYQTIILPDGRKVEGLFPTDKWFESICEHLSFSDKTLLDLGCNIGAYCTMALNNGAKHVTGIDRDLKWTGICSELFSLYEHDRYTLVAGDVEKVELPKTDITIVGMLLHHLKQPKILLRRLRSVSTEIVIIYRNDSIGTGFRPKIQELNTVMGTTAHFHQQLPLPTNQEIGLAIYHE